MRRLSGQGDGERGDASRHDIAPEDVRALALDHGDLADRLAVADDVQLQRG
jgi:hypothetical protein